MPLGTKSGAPGTPIQSLNFSSSTSTQLLRGQVTSPDKGHPGEEWGDSSRATKAASRAPSTDCSSFKECFIISRAGNQLPRRIVSNNENSHLKSGVRSLWADKYSPTSFSSFQCHARLTLQLKQLTSIGHCPHLLLRGPHGAGKKALATALVHNIFGDIKALPEQRPFLVQGGDLSSITIPITSSRYHVEINLLHVKEFEKDILPTIFKEINLSSEMARKSPIHSDFGFKVLVLQNAEVLSLSAQQILRRLMDKYGDTCKVVFCSNVQENASEETLGEGIKSRCQIIDVEEPVQEEIIKVLSYIARKEGIILPKNIATRIADQCKHNLRRAIVQLEACKNYRYPFKNDQPVQSGVWEEIVIGIADDIVKDPSTKSSINVRARMQSLLQDCISPVLIIQKLLEELLKRVDLQLKKQICHWAGYYEMRLQTHSHPINQLEAFLGKFVNIYKTHINARSQPAKNMQALQSNSHSNKALVVEGQPVHGCVQGYLSSGCQQDALLTEF